MAAVQVFVRVVFHVVGFRIYTTQMFNDDGLISMGNQKVAYGLL